MKFNIFQIITIIALFQSVLIACFLFSNTKRFKINNFILAILLSIYSLIIAGSLLQTVGIGHLFLQQHKLLFILRQCLFLIGPLVYFYILSMINPNFKFKRKHIIHFIPFILALCYYSIKIYPINNFIIGKSNLRFFNSASMLSLNIGYLVMSLFQLKKIKQNRILSGIKQKNIFWLKFVISGFIFLWTIQFNTFLILDVAFQIQWCPYMASLYSIGIFIVFNSMIFIILKKPILITNINKYQNSSLSEQKKEEIKVKVIDYIVKKRSYLDPLITIKKMSDELGIPARYISQVINESFNQSFSDYINNYRITESKNLLMNNMAGEKNILQIAYHVGFNSKSSFNEVFKKHTGLTPSAYRNKHCCKN